MDKLEDRAAVERRPHPSDRRVKAPVPSERGVRIRQELSERLRAGTEPVRGLTASQLRDLRDLLLRAMNDEPTP